MPIALNIDLGELDDEPEGLYAAATTVNIACGGHAGDDRSMERAIRLALRRGHDDREGCRIAAHPSYVDREGFGRRARFGDLAALPRAIEEQVRRLVEIASACGARVVGVKPHGALYHDASVDPALGDAVVAAARAAAPDLLEVTGPAGGALASATARAGLAFLREGFADRRYLPDGRLAPRSEPGALIEDPDACAAQALALVARGDVDSICVHGDTAGALAIAARVRAALSSGGRDSR